MDSDMAAVLGVVGMVGVAATLVGWIVWLFARTKRERIRALLEVQRRTLEKLGSAEELTGFAATETGGRFLEGLTAESQIHADRIFGAIQRGAVLSLLGLGLCLVGGLDGDLRNALYVGILALAMGLGFLASAGVSHRLARRWGLVPSRPPE